MVFQLTTPLGSRNPIEIDQCLNRGLYSENSDFTQIAAEKEMLKLATIHKKIAGDFFRWQNVFNAKNFKVKSPIKTLSLNRWFLNGEEVKRIALYHSYCVRPV